MDEDEYRTSDLGLAAAICQALSTSCEVEWITERRAEFQFKNSTRIGEIAEQFLAHEFLVDANSYLQAVKNLKYRLYEARK